MWKNSLKRKNFEKFEHLQFLDQFLLFDPVRLTILEYFPTVVYEILVPMNFNIGKWSDDTVVFLKFHKMDVYIGRLDIFEIVSMDSLLKRKDRNNISPSFKDPIFLYFPSGLFK